MCVCVCACAHTYSIDTDIEIDIDKSAEHRHRYGYLYVCIPTDTNKRATAFTAPATEQLSARSAAAASLFHMRLQSLDCMDGMVWSRARPKDTIPEPDRTVSSCLDCMHATARPDSGRLGLPRGAGTACFYTS